MIRLAWRQFRLQAAIAGVLVAIVAAVALVTGPHLAHLYDTLVKPCASRHDCPTATTVFLDNDHFLQASLPVLLLAAPALIGVFWGAPLVAREIEAGTFRLVWTQSVSRLRWLATRLGLVGLVSMAVTGVLSLVVNWWFSPIDRVNLNRLSPAMFGVRGIAPIGYAAFGFALGVTVGVLVRRTLPAMALTLVGFIAARLAVTYWVRPRLSSPLQAVTPLTLQGAGPGPQTAGDGVPFGSWVLSDETVARNGRVIGANGGIGPNGGLGLRVSKGGEASIPGVGTCPSVRLPNPRSATGPPTGGASVQHAFDTCARHLGLRQVVTYQPASRFWPFQWYETGIFLVLALLLVALCIWWLVVRERRLAVKARKWQANVAHPVPLRERGKVRGAGGRSVPTDIPADVQAGGDADEETQSTRPRALLVKRGELGGPRRSPLPPTAS